MQVVGIVGDVKEQVTDDVVPTVYFYKRERQYGGMTIAIRTAADPLASRGRPSPRSGRSTKTSRSRTSRRWTA